MKESVGLKIDGMSCGHCVSSVTKALKALPGVLDTKVEIGSAIVTYEAEKASLDKIKEAVEEAGYDVTGVAQ